MVSLVNLVLLPSMLPDFHLGLKKGCNRAVNSSSVTRDTLQISLLVLLPIEMHVGCIDLLRQTSISVSRTKSAMGQTSRQLTYKWSIRPFLWNLLEQIWQANSKPGREARLRAGRCLYLFVLWFLSAWYFWWLVFRLRSSLEVPGGVPIGKELSHREWRLSSTARPVRNSVICASMEHSITFPWFQL